METNCGFVENSMQHTARLHLCEQLLMPTTSLRGRILGLTGPFIYMYKLYKYICMHIYLILRQSLTPLLKLAFNSSVAQVGVESVILLPQLLQ